MFTSLENFVSSVQYCQMLLSVEFHAIYNTNTYASTEMSKGHRQIASRGQPVLPSQIFQA